jgi:predicted Zn finger-like uncharacterized protein
MKVECGQCPAKYAVSDERVRDRKVRIHCKRCGASIIVDGKVEPPLVTSTPARPSVRPPISTAPLPETPPAHEPDPESNPSPRPVAHTIMGGLEAPAAERLQQQVAEQMAVLSEQAMRSPASPYEPRENESPRPHEPAGDRGLTDPPAGADDSRWRVALTKQDLRWMTTSEIVEAFRSGAVKHETFVFRAGMPTWVTLPEVPEIAAALTAAVANGAASPSSLPPPEAPASRPPPRRVRSDAADATAQGLGELDAAEPLPFALVAERSSGANPAPAAPEQAAYGFEPAAPDRPSLEAIPVEHLSHIPDEPLAAAPAPFAAAEQASGSKKWIWIVVLLLLLLAAAGAFLASRHGSKLF